MKSFPAVFAALIYIITCGCSGDDKVLCEPSKANPSYYTSQNHWTIMVYADGDNNLEEALIYDFMEMKAGFVDNQGVRLIALVDRINGYHDDASVFGENFTDTRLYEIKHNSAVRISGGTEFPEITTVSNYDANMGDANTLKKFINYCKNNYPADHYALILWDHGNGPRKKGDVEYTVTTAKGICVDESSDNDMLHIGEISDVLTIDESVDLLGFDACFMGSAEVAYQFRPGKGGFEADIMVASAPLEWGYGWKYDRILSRLGYGGGFNGESDSVAGLVDGFSCEKYYNPESMSARDLAQVIVEEQYDSTVYDESQSLSSYDLSAASDVKAAVDNLALSLVNSRAAVEKIRGTGYAPKSLYYIQTLADLHWVESPFFDLYDVAERIYNDSSDGIDDFSPSIEAKAYNVMTAVDRMIQYSFAGRFFTGLAYGGYKNGRNGLSIVLPDGNKVYGTHEHWYYQRWYNANNLSSQELTYWVYGKLKWCIDRESSTVNVVDNWFELLDSWFDGTDNNTLGGDNEYQW